MKVQMHIKCINNFKGAVHIIIFWGPQSPPYNLTYRIYTGPWFLDMDYSQMCSAGPAWSIAFAWQLHGAY